MSKENQTITLKDGRKLGFAEYGDQKGKPVFFFHGWPSSRLQAEPLDIAAKNAKVRLISVDRPGYGLSEYKKDRKLLDWPDDVIELADTLKIKSFAVEGVSGGGPYAAVCAYKIPERLIKVGIVVGLGPTWIPGILDGLPFTGKIGWANFSKHPILAYLGTWYHEIESKYFPGFSMFQFRAKVDQAILKKEKSEYIKNRKETFRQGSKGAILDLLLYTKSWGFNISKIKSKVLLFYGSSDINVTLAMADYYNKHIRGSKLTVYPNEGHLIQITHAEEILKILVQ